MYDKKPMTKEQATQKITTTSKNELALLENYLKTVPLIQNVSKGEKELTFEYNDNVVKINFRIKYTKQENFGTFTQSIFKTAYRKTEDKDFITLEDFYILHDMQGNFTYSIMGELSSKWFKKFIDDMIAHLDNLQ